MNRQWLGGEPRDAQGEAVPVVLSLVAQVQERRRRSILASPIPNVRLNDPIPRERSAKAFDADGPNRRRQMYRSQGRVSLEKSLRATEIL